MDANGFKLISLVGLFGPGGFVSVPAPKKKDGQNEDRSLFPPIQFFSSCHLTVSSTELYENCHNYQACQVRRWLSTPIIAVRYLLSQIQDNFTFE